MSTTILIEESPFGLRAMAADDEGRPVRLLYRLTADKRAEAGSVHWARAGRRDKRTNLQRFDLGQAGEGMLPVKDRQYPEGQMVLMGVRREALGGKLPLLTDRPSLHLPAATLRPESSEHRPGPLGLLEPPKLAAFPGDRLRTPGPAADIPPAASLLASLAKGETEGVFVSSGELRAALKPFVPDTLPIETAPDLNKEFAEVTADALARTAPLEEGGALIIDETEALTAIDVDLGGTQAQSAKGAGDSLRKRALNELGRALSLRGIGGQVVLDLPRSAVRAPKVLRDGLTSALKAHGPVSIPAVTKEGLVMLVLGQNRPSLLETLTEPGEDAPLPGRRFRPAVEAWMAYDKILSGNERGRGLGAVSLSPLAAEAWREAGASSALLSLRGAEPQLVVRGAKSERTGA